MSSTATVDMAAADTGAGVMVVGTDVVATVAVVTSDRALVAVSSASVGDGVMVMDTTVDTAGAATTRTERRPSGLRGATNAI